MKGSLSAGICLGAALFFVSGCAGSPRESRWYDERYAVYMDVGADLVEAGHYPQAIAPYQNAFNQALSAMDAQAISVAGYNLATAQLRGGSLEDARATVDQARAALKNPGSEGQPALALVEAVIDYREGNFSAAARSAREATAGGCALKGQGLYVLGLAQMGVSDYREIPDIMQRIRALSCKGERGNLLDLQTRLALGQREWQKAVDGGRQLIGIRRSANDYPAMRTALRLTAEALQQQGRMQEAENFRQQARVSESAQKKLVP